MNATVDSPCQSRRRITGLRSGSGDVRESGRARRYPISRWYLRPAAGYLAVILAPTRVRPTHLTICGLAVAVAAAGALVFLPEMTLVAAVLVLAVWFFDRADGQLARHQQTVSARGAWLDANVDELVDVGLHVAVAAVAASATSSSLPWFLLIAFLAGKYLLMYGLTVEETFEQEAGQSHGRHPQAVEQPNASGWLRKMYHLPGNADVRIHLLVAALATGWLTAELALVAFYYNLRWIVRYALVPRRLGGAK